MAVTTVSRPAVAPVLPPAVVRPPGRLSTVRVTRKLVLPLLMVLGCLVVLLFTVRVHDAVGTGRSAVTDVGVNGAAGIASAQQIKSDLAELDLLATQELVRPTASKGDLPAAYNDTHKALVANLVEAGQHITLGTAETLPLGNVLYGLSQYQALVREAVLTDQGGDHAAALVLGAQAHAAMIGPYGLQGQADAFDKANTYALNQRYQEHKAQSGNARGWLQLTALAVLLVLVGSSVWHAISFRRLLNIGLVGAAVVCLATFGWALVRIGSSTDHLTEARERAFDPVHGLFQARAAAFAARDAEAQALADPTTAAAAQADFDTAVRTLYRLPDDAGNAAIASAAAALTTPEGSGGFLAAELARTGVSEEGVAAADEASRALAAYIAADGVLRGQGATAAAASYYGTANGQDGATFDRLTKALDAALTIDRAAFTKNADAADGALDGVSPASTVAAVLMVVLILGGLWLRLREYVTA